jgi:hypothetical protein
MAGKTKKQQMVGFVPAISFEGYPDEVTRTFYAAGKPAEAPATYVELLRRKGLVADNIPDTTETVAVE